MGHKSAIVPQSGDGIIRIDETPYLRDARFQVQRVQGYLVDFGVWSVAMEMRDNANGSGTYIQFCVGDPFGRRWKEVPEPTVEHQSPAEHAASLLLAAQNDLLLFARGERGTVFGSAVEKLEHAMKLLGLAALDAAMTDSLGTYVAPKNFATASTSRLPTR